MGDIVDRPQTRQETLLMDIRDGTETDLGSPLTRKEALLMGIRDQGGTGGIPVASTTTLGGVKIDGETIIIDENGVISMAVSSGDSVSY